MSCEKSNRPPSTAGPRCVPHRMQYLAHHALQWMAEGVQTHTQMHVGISERRQAHTPAKAFSDPVITIAPTPSAACAAANNNGQLQAATQKSV